MSRDIVKSVVQRLTKPHVPPPSFPPKKEKPPVCCHSQIQLYVDPCLKCNQFCNCRHTYFPKLYPDILVRSMDKHIVRLTGGLVRASITLSEMVDKHLNRGPGKQEIQQPLEEEKMVIKTECNNSSSVMYYKEDCRMEVDDDESDQDQTYGKAENNKDSCEIKDLIELQSEDKLLVLFDTKSNQPTLGISKEILMKVDYYICQHLDEVDMRVEAKRRKYEFWVSSAFGEPPDEDLYNTFAFEDWEEDFFNVDHGTFHDFHKANQELLIWDLYLAIEKWTLLFRGQPAKMVNGWYDIPEPDYMNPDGRNPFGLYGIPFRNPRGKCHHNKNERFNLSDFNRVHFTPKWWTVTRKGSN